MAYPLGAKTTDGFLENAPKDVLGHEPLSSSYVPLKRRIV